MALYKDHIKIEEPYFAYVVGKSREGKTYFINELVNQVSNPKKHKIIYIVNNGFPTEPEILEKAQENKNVFIIRAPDLSQKTIDFLTSSMKTKAPKTLVFDNFTYQLSLPFLNFVTFARKYNASTIFISHTIYASEKISPRLRESVSYFVCFYLPDDRSYKRILPDNVYEAYKQNILHKSYKFLIYDIGESEYTVGKLPEYKIEIKHLDEFKGRSKKGLKLQEELEKYKEEQSDSSLDYSRPSKPKKF